MACIGSGTNALDRGLEALAATWSALTRVPEKVQWQQTFGKTEVTLNKRYRTRPLGIALVIACASFPAWNAYPAILANLAAEHWTVATSTRTCEECGHTVYSRDGDEPAPKRRWPS